MKVKYTIEQIHPKVFLVGIENSYDLAMTFCRVQEFYESPYKEIKGKPFTMMEFQRIYSMRREDGCFTYPIDWAGFNVPSDVIHQLYYSDKIEDKNQYDNVFYNILNEIGDYVEMDDKYYVIGSDPLSKTTIDHEVAHAFYYLYPFYKKDVNKVINKIPVKIFNKFRDALYELRYSSKVLKDEIQAYLLTDLEIINKSLNKKESKIINQLSKEINEINKQYKGVV